MSSESSKICYLRTDISRYTFILTVIRMKSGRIKPREREREEEHDGIAVGFFERKPRSRFAVATNFSAAWYFTVKVDPVKLEPRERSNYEEPIIGRVIILRTIAARDPTRAQIGHEPLRNLNSV